MQYTVDYFIKKFEAIPSRLIIAHNVEFQNKGCALGWCAGSKPSSDCYDTKEYKALVSLFFAARIDSVTRPGTQTGWAVADVNNGDNPNYQQTSPKKRILAALYDIKKMQEPKVKEVIKYVAVPTTISEQVAETVLN